MGAYTLTDVLYATLRFSLQGHIISLHTINTIVAIATAPFVGGFFPSHSGSNPTMALRGTPPTHMLSSGWSGTEWACRCPGFKKTSVSEVLEE